LIEDARAVTSNGAGDILDRARGVERAVQLRRRTA
jgi:hypothetical protein